ncbi:GNAT family N-acetyltransferase [Streptosporangiaceae bacterium NEAU-GS5]|nr:GNAT family N-acetyltransferase [Streptosporangiaceae bacterium NEAU-GS5]
MDTFDRLVDAAWPAPNRVRAGDWVFRHAAGVTKRANSVLPLGEGSIEAAERFYAGLGQPCVFSIGDGAPEGLDGKLAARGYRLVDPTFVMTAPAAAIETADGVVVAHAPSVEWLDTWWSVDGARHADGREWGERILSGVPAGYASIGFPMMAAVGRGVRQGEWLGVYCMAVRPADRRRGLARAILRGLRAWGAGRKPYLLVTEANTAARALYEGEGFVVTSRYHYRVMPTA